MFFPRKKPPEPEPGSREKHQKIDKIHVLKRCPLFKALSGWELSSISRLTRITEFKKNEIVYSAGDAAEFFYIVISGRFEAFIVEKGRKQVLAYLKQGSYFGEMSLLSADEKHTATIQSLSDSLVLGIAKDDFKKILEGNAGVSLEISRGLSARLKAQNARSRPALHLLKSDIIAVYSARGRGAGALFAGNLAASLRHETGQRTILVEMEHDDSTTEKAGGARASLADLAELESGAEGALARHLVEHESGIGILRLVLHSADRASPEFAVHLLNRLAVDFRFIITDLPDRLSGAVERVMSQADHLFLETDTNTTNVAEIQEILRGLDPSLSEKCRVVISEALLGFSPTRSAREELFGKRDCFFLPAAPTQDPRPEFAAFAGPDTEYGKLIRLIARKISKNMIGLALGSGAALGFAHIGVLKVLEREKIPIDCVAGSSIGAVIAAFYATGRTPEEMESIASKITRATMITKIDFSLPPAPGLVIGRRLERYLGSFLGDATFEETKIPLIIVGMSLHSRREIVMTGGPITPAIRASIAIPGIFHPVMMDGDMIVDGGIIDPLPIRPLAELGANKIIAVDVLPTSNDVLEKRKYREEFEKRVEAKIKNRNLMVRAAYRFRKAVGRMFTPNVFDIIVNAMQTMEHEMAETLSAEADVLIRPSMPLANWTEFHKAKEIIRQGEAAAEAKLDQIKALVRRPS